jgi:3-oxoadipate enol-lactonase
LNTEDVLTGAVDRPYGQLQYAVSGRNHGQAVLLLHPLGSDLAFWQPQLETLGLRFRVIRFDARGHGGSVIGAGAALACTMTDLLDDACAVLDELDVGRAHWCGLSLGGAVALQAALSVPARVQRLVLAHTAAAFPPRGLWDERISTASTQGMTPLVEGLGARWFSPGFAIANPAAVQEAEATLRKVQPRGYAECCAALRDFDVSAELGAVRASTLVIGGAQDIATPPERAESLHDLIPGADLLMLDSGHLSNVEQAEEFSEAVSGFLQD